MEDIGSFLSKLAEKSEGVYWLSSPDFEKIQYISPAYEKIWGRPREELYREPKKWITFLHPEDAKDHHPIEAMRDRVAKLGANARYEENYRIIRPDGEIRWILDRGFPVMDDEGNCCGVTGVAVDVTEERRLQEELQQTKESEARFKAMSALGGMMAHELQNPLVAIKGSLYGIERALPTLIEGYALSVKTGQVKTPLRQDLLNGLKQAADNIKHSVNYAEATISSILAGFHYTSSEELSHIEPFSLQQTIHQALQNYPFRETERALVIVKHIDDVMIMGDPAIVTHVLHNLIKNALHVIEAAQKGAMTIWTELQADTVKLYFEDSASGIEPERLIHIFDPFYTTKRATAQSVGLGLYFCKMSLEKMGAFIECESEVGQYTHFIITLPLVGSKRKIGEL
ncbi:MAG: hypothetical protein A3F67_07065 [Verrucomicrobia bacterium RIFCSPHIGHO2_12_FULL_41_10]|nr:MAG: hypothetical protein A3F67_07065 [Verrucomicrobia bacterium RIFCSPHIGHO2_12_FULL_41_10]